MTDRELQNLWERLQNKKPTMPHFLEKISMTDTGIRGISDAQVEFKYPVSVLAGSNGSGKSTVLFSTICAYAKPGTSKDTRSRSSEKRSSWEFSPFKISPDYEPKSGEQENEKGSFTASFEYSTPNGRRSACFLCSKMWNDVTQERGLKCGYPEGNPPERSVYTITSEDFIDSSGGGRVSYSLDGKTDMQKVPFSLSQMEFARQLLPGRYLRVVALSHPSFNYRKETSLLSVEQKNGMRYHESHMAGGERAIFRLSQKIAEARGGLVLIDEVETRLHPSLQKSLMLKLQELALCNDLQIIVTTHSPAVLDSVPPIGRIFLERDEKGKILAGPAYTDLVYRALYGHYEKQFKLLCEDETAKSVLKGVFDVIIACDPPAEEESLNIDYTKDGASEFPRYARILKESNQDFVFILDGDQRFNNEGIKKKICSATEHSAQVMFLPGRAGPEEWVWERMRVHSNNLATMLDLDASDLIQEMDKQDNHYSFEAGSVVPSGIIKKKFHHLLKSTKCRNSPKTIEFFKLKICRMVSRLEAKQENSDIQPLVKQLKDAFQAWREGAEDLGETEKPGETEEAG